MTALTCLSCAHVQLSESFRARPREIVCTEGITGLPKQLAECALANYEPGSDECERTAEESSGIGRSS